MRQQTTSTALVVCTQIQLRSVVIAAAAAAATLAVPAQSSSQVLRGRTVNVETSTPVAGARITVVQQDSVAGTAVSDTAGTFQIRVAQAGRYVLRAEMIGFRSVESEPIDIGSSEMVEITLRMSTVPLALAPIEVRSRTMDPRHLDSFEGFKARHALFPPIGNRRAVLRDDPELVNAISVRDALTWFPPPRRCVQVYLNGVINKDRSALDLSASLVHGVEFYRHGIDAPLMMGHGSECSIVAVWTIHARR